MHHSNKTNKKAPIKITEQNQSYQLFAPRLRSGLLFLCLGLLFLCSRFLFLHSELLFLYSGVLFLYSKFLFLCSRLLFSRSRLSFFLRTRIFFFRSKLSFSRPKPLLFRSGLLLLFCTLFLFTNNITKSAPDESDLTKSEIFETIFEAKINLDDIVSIHKSTLLDASNSIILDEETFGPAEYYWNLHNDKSPKKGKEQIYKFKNSGQKKITLTIKQGDKTTSATKEIFAYEKTAILITDKKQDSIQEIIKQAAEYGIWLQTITMESENLGFLTESQLMQKIKTSSSFISKAEIFIFYTKTTDSLSSFTRYFYELNQAQKFSLTNKIFVNISDHNLNIQKEIVDRSRKTLKIPEILLTRPEALTPIFATKDLIEIKNIIKQRVIEYQVINDQTARSNFFILSKIVAFFISSGIPSSTIYLLLIFPFLAFLVTFFRQFVGISTFGVYLPIMISLSFFMLGSYFTLITLTFISLIGMLIRLALEKFYMLYIPRVALILSTIVFSFFIVIWIVLKSKLSVVVPIAIFPMLVISTLSEKFISTQYREGTINATMGIIETVLVAFLSYIITNGNIFKNILISYPETMLLPLLGIIILGRFTGLRLTEFFKFRSLLLKDIEE